jgi:hypothetical protein
MRALLVAIFLAVAAFSVPTVRAAPAARAALAFGAAPAGFDDADAAPPMARPRALGGMGGLGGVLVAVVIYALLSGARPGGNGLSWGSYYLFWLVAPMVIAVVSSNPWVLLVVLVGVVARPWLPDPFLLARRFGQVLAMKRRCAANPHDSDALAHLASLYLELRRPLKALPLAEQALAREPESTELRYVRGLCLLGAKRWSEAADTFVDVVHREPRFRYGDPYLRAADALTELARWDDAADALDAFQAINRSSLEAWCKLAVIRRRQGDVVAARAARHEARKLYGELPGYQRRKQLLWYLRSFV